MLLCPHHQYCSGCDHWLIPEQTQKENKINYLWSLLKENFEDRFSLEQIQWFQIQTDQLRDKLDFTLDEGKLGLYTKTTPQSAQNFSRQVHDLDRCLQLSPQLQEWLSEFRFLLPPVKKASIRLRVSPEGKKGVWLDLANLDLKNLLIEKSYLLSLMKIAEIEVGQHQKTCIDLADPLQLKLQAAKRWPWFETRFQNYKVPLYSHLSDFSQPSHKTNAWITNWFSEKTRTLSPSVIYELGCGNGNLSFPLLSSGAKLYAFEISTSAVEGFQQSLRAFENTTQHSLLNQLSLFCGDAISKDLGLNLPAPDLCVLNPPRKGFGHFLNLKTLPKTVLYMSCYPEAFAEDALRLKKLGFRLSELNILDQFPKTRHMEVLSEWDNPES